MFVVKLSSVLRGFACHSPASLHQSQILLHHTLPLHLCLHSKPHPLNHTHWSHPLPCSVLPVCLLPPGFGGQEWCQGQCHPAAVGTSCPDSGRPGSDPAGSVAGQSQPVGYHTRAATVPRWLVSLSPLPLPLKVMLSCR